MIVDIRRVRKHKQLGYGKAIAEVCKYALKFGDLSVEKTWEAYMVLKGDRKVGLRLSGSLGYYVVSKWTMKRPQMTIYKKIYLISRCYTNCIWQAFVL